MTSSAPHGWPAKLTIVWRSAAALGALALTVAGWQISVNYISLIGPAETVLGEYRTLSLKGFASADGTPLSGTEEELGRVAHRMETLARRATVARSLSIGLSWVPLLDYEVAAWAAQANALHLFVDSAVAVLPASRRLADAYREARDAFLSPSGSAPSKQPLVDIAELQLSFASAVRQVAANRASDQPLPVTARRWAGELASIEEARGRTLTALRIGLRASILLDDLMDVEDHAGPIIGQFLGDSEQPKADSPSQLKVALLGLDRSVQAAIAETEVLAAMVARSGSDTELDGLDDLGRVLRVLLLVSRATITAITAVESELEDGLGRTGLLGDQPALLGMLTGIGDHVEDVEEAIDLLEIARATISALETPINQLVPDEGLRQISTMIDAMWAALSLLRDLAPVGDSLLGDGTARRYLVLAHSADELRATGGFVSGLWVVTFENGALVDLRYQDTVRVDDWSRLELYPRTPEGLEEHMNAQVWLMRDVSWEPDFPTTARMAKLMYDIGQRQDVDGVIAINQWSLLAVVESLGGIPSPGGGLITPLNLFTNLEQGTDDHGRAYVDLVLEGALERLKQPVSLPELAKLSSALYSSLIKRDVLVFIDDPEVQSVFQRHGWDGRIRHDRGDYLYVVDSNVGWSKSDRNIERAVTYEIDLRSSGAPRASMTLQYVNHSGPGSPGCEPQWRSRGRDYGQLKNACYWNYWRVYLPQRSRLLGHTPYPLPEYSVSVEIGRGKPGEDTFRVSSSYDKTVLSGLFPLEAGAVQEVSFVYDLPPDVLRRDGEQILYSLLVQKQPGVRKRKLHVKLLLPQEFRLLSSSIDADLTSDSSVEFSLTIERDMEISVVLTRRDRSRD